MRSLRALAHLVLALALVMAGAAQARVIGTTAPAVVAVEHASHEHVSHGHGPAPAEHPLHKRDGCQTACCSTPGETASRAPDPGRVAVCRAVRYGSVRQAPSGRAEAPEPGIPKQAA